MAFVTDVNCKECGKTKHEVTFNDNVCSSCRKKISSKKRRMHLAALKGLTPEERLEKIEQALYDADADGRLKALESIHQTYS